MSLSKKTVSEYITPKDVEEQESLSKDLLSRLNVIEDKLCKANVSICVRPSANFIDLMDWVKECFSPALKDRSNLNKYVHNRISIDGQFLLFCKENDVTVQCLHKDSIISWRTDHDFEKFFAQGVFLIKSKNVEFLHAALFHKGCNNEDEVCFFVICSDKNYESYLSLRNSFDDWALKRDRGNLNIKVIDGDDIPYDKNHDWSDLFMPNSLKNEIKNLIDNFLKSKDFYLANHMPWKRGVLFWGHAGNGKTSLIKTIISNYDFKPVTITPFANDDALREAFSYAEEQSPSLLFFEDLDSMLERNIDLSSFLNLMDGISAKNGLLVVATANDIRRFKPSITDRPSRFDRKFEIPLPTAEMAYIYLRRWFGSSITPKKCRELSRYAEKLGFSYAYLKELYISSMFEGLSNNRKIPTEKDIENALNSLIKEKDILNPYKVISTDKYLK